MIPSLLRDISPTQDSFGTKITIIQQWIASACVNAGITIPMGTPLLRDIDPLQDSEGTKLAILQRWLKLLANNISGAGSSAQAGNVALTAGVTNLAIVFGTAFAAAPSVVCNLVPPGGGNPILISPTSVTATGFTAQWGVAVPAGYSLVWVATKTTQ